MVQTLERKQTEQAKNYLGSKFPNGFCSAPFSQLFVQPNGDVFICCQGVGYLGNIKDYTLEELWNGEKVQLLRKEFLSGEIKTCRNLMDSIGCHINYDDNLAIADLSMHQDQLPRALEVILNGQCNIECIMCETKNDLTSILNATNFESEIINKALPNIQLLNIKGGEPFIQKETFHLLSKMKQINPNCNWIFTTNGQYKFNRKLRTELESINLKKITFSIDSLDPELFSQIRLGADLSTTETSMLEVKKWLQEKNASTELTLNITVQQQNWKNIPETIKHYDELGVNPCLIYVYYPKEFSLSNLTDEEKIEIVNYYFNLPAKYNKYAGSFYHVLKPLFASSENTKLKKLKALWNYKISDISNSHETNYHTNY